MKRILALLMLIGVVLASGCVGQTTTKQPTGANGLIISDFSPDASKIMADDSVNLNLEVQNVGGAPANTVNVYLYGVTFGTGDYDWSIEGLQSFLLTEQLLPPEEGVPGELATNVWTLRAPKGIKSDTTFTFDTRIDYEYTTDVTGMLTFVSKSYWDSLSREEKQAMTAKAGFSQMTQTGGPISITMYAGQRTRPFVIDPSVDHYTMRVTVNNIGSGEPRDVIKLTSADASTGISIDCDDGAYSGLTLSRGKTASFSCDIIPGTEAMAISNKQDFTTSLSFSYGWRVDSSTDIIVQRALS
jgi:hypothetical protein